MGGRGEAEQRLPSFMIDFLSRIKDQGRRRKVGPGGWHVRTQRIKDHGPCFGTNEHPRRDTDVILRQSRAPLELFNFR